MVKSVYVDKAGEILEFPDTTTPQQIREYINRAYGAAQSTAAPAPEAPVGPDESGVFGRFAYGFGTGLTNIPGGIAALGLPAEKAAKTSAGQFSEEARKYLQETFGIDPTKDPTAAQQAAEALGSVASFLVPGSAVAKGVSLIGRTASLAGRAGAATAAAQGVALGSGARAEKIQSQLASGMEISEEDQLAAQRLDGLIGASEALPLGRFFGPINTLLSKVPLAKAPIVEQIVKSRLAKVTRSGLAEGAQEVASGIANDLVEMGVYNPDVELGQDLMSNFGTGAFAGSFVEGLIQLAAGRKLRPYRQLEEDLGKESALNAQAQRQGEISRAAEELRKINVQGDVEIVEDEFDGISRFVVRTPAGNTVGDFLDAAEAEEAVNIYKQRTDANITIRKPAELPSVFPVKINGKEYTTTNDVIADRDSIVSKKEGLAAYMSRPDVIKREAARQNVSEDLVKKATAEEVADLDKQIVKLNEFVAAAKPTPTIVSPASAMAATLRREPTRYKAEPPVPEGEGTVTPTETIAQEAPVGVAEAVSTEAPITEAPAIVEAPAPSVGPVEATGNRTLAGPLKEAPTPRRTLSQAEAEGPIVRDYNQATINRYAGIYTALKSRLAGKVPKNAEIKLEELISTPASLLVKGRARVEKTPNGIKSIVDLSTGILRPDMTVEDAVNELIGTLDHEIIHVLRDQGLIRPTEWNMLSKAATSTKVPGRAYTYLDKAQTVYTPGGQPISPIYANPDSVIEEAVAEMYKDWVKNQKAPVQVRGLFNRITEFFRSIFRILKSNKHQDIFKAIDTGEIGAREGVGRESIARFSAGPSYDPSKSTSDWETGGAPPPGISSVNKTGGSPFRISQRRPTTKKEVGQSLANNLKIDVAAMRLEPGQLEHNIALVRDYVGFPTKQGETAEQTLKRFKKHVIENLLWLHDSMEPGLRSRAKLWYDGARVIADDLAAKYDLPDTTVAAVMAGLSPQKDWFQNVSLAERVIDIVKTQQNTVFDSNMLSHARTRPALAKYDLILQAMEDVAFKDLNKIDFANVLARKHNEINAGLYSKAQIEMMNKNGVGTLAKAIFVRVYDEVNNQRSFNIITPEGQKAGPVLTSKGVESKVAWNGFTDIGKAITAIEDGTKETIDTLLGSYHKVRNFYNNILSPKSTDGSVTMDTHAIAAALLRALAGTADEVSHNFGTLATKNSGKTGVQGLYAVYADAYREAAKMRGILPREMQSITWEAVRGLYKAKFKAQDKNVNAIDAIWRLHSNGKITAKEARKRILDLADPGAEGINSPFWKGTPSTVIHGVGGPALNTAGVVGLGIRQAAARTGSRGVGRNAGGVKGTQSGGRFSAAPALNSEEFSKWFKRSKAVDVDGTPLVVYHGTMSNFSSFDRNKLQSATGGFEDSLVGFMFTNNPRAAAMFSLGDKRGISGQVMPVYLSVQNPLVLDLSDAITVKIDGIPKYTDGAMMSAAEKVLGIKLTSSWGGPLDGSGENMLNALRAQGYDGVHVKNSSFGAVTPAKERNVGGRVGAWDVWIALDPEQVKSKMNPFEEGAATSPRLSAAPALNSAEFKKWFRSSKIVDASGKPLVVYHGTADVFDEFKQDTGGKKDRGWLGRGFYFTNNTGVANAYAMIKRGFSENVIPVYISVQNPYYATLEEKAQLKAAEQSGDTFAAQEFTDKLKAAGHDGVVLDYRSEDGAKEYVIFDAAQAKSIFNEFKEGAATSPRLSAAPLPPYVEAKNRTLFVPEEKRSFVKDMFDFFFGPPASGRTLNTIYGQIDVKSKTRLAVSARTAIVDMDAAFEFLEKTANQKDTGNFQRREATQSTIVALGMARRSSQLTAATVTQGAPIISFSRPGDIQSATVSMRNDADRLIDIFKVMLEPGPVDSVTSERKDKRTVFKMYASAKRAIGLKAAGLAVPSELDDTYINTTIPFVQQNYPEIVEAYEKYQRFNKKLITAARDAGRITDADLAKYTQQMDYYGFYREVYEEQLVPGMPSKLAGDIKIREYKGSQRGELIEDPMLVILTNVNFWMGAITRNIATNKAFKLAKDMGEARLLGASEKPDLSQGESEQVMFFRENGVQKRFAVKDPLLVTSLGADDGADMGAAMRLIGLPTTALRESVTRDPVFMVRNLLRDTLSSWITSGEDITPFIGTINGFRKALNNSSSYQALIGRGVVGSHDLAMRSPAEMAAIIRRRALPKGIMDVTSIDGMQGLIMSGWDRLGVWSEASDAATRIAVYESAIKQGMSEAEAAFRAIEIMNFSRRGSSSFLQILTRLVPFLNARIQGMDVLYQAGKAGVMTATGYQLGERDANLGKKFLYRGAILAAISVGLQMMLDGDEDYEEIPDYVKNGNILLPLKWLGVEGGYFAAVPKPFEAGLLFSTIPQELYKATTGQASGREMANFFWSEFVSTFGVNPVPQFLLPAGEAITNYDVYTGLPLISEGKARLTPELQYDARTSSVAMMLGDIPIKYNFTTGKFEGVSPIIIDQLISGYGGPMGSYFMQGIGLLMEGADVAPERLPKDITQLPGIKSFLLDAESRSPKSVAQAYELFRVVDEVNRSFSRLRQTGDVEATMDYLEQNKNVLAYKKHIYRLFDGLNKLSARERQIERDETMTRDEKFAAMKQLREVRARLTSNIGEINKALGR